MILTPWLWTLVYENVSVKPYNKISKRITMYVGGFSTIFAWIIKDICKKFICFGVGLVCNKIFLLYRMTFRCNFWFNFGSEESYGLCPSYGQAGPPPKKMCIDLEHMRVSKNVHSNLPLVMAILGFLTIPWLG